MCALVCFMFLFVLVFVLVFVFVFLFVFVCLCVCVFEAAFCRLVRETSTEPSFWLLLLLGSLSQFLDFALAEIS